MGNVLAVTGASGKSGSVFTQFLIDNENDVLSKFSGGVRFITRSADKLAYVKEKLTNSEVIEGSIEDDEFLSQNFKEVDTIVHIAGIRWTEHIVKAVVKNHVRRMILVHTTGIYSKYKAAGEEYRRIDDYTYKTCKKYSILLTILRPTMIYGKVTDHNVISFIKMVDKLTIMPVVNGAHYKLQPVHYADLGEAYYKVLMSEETTTNKDFNLSGGAEIELREMLNVIGKNLHKKVRFISCPFSIAYAGAWVVYVVTFTRKDYRERVQRLCEPRMFSHEPATEAFGYNPRTFQDGVVAEIKEYKGNK